MNKTAMFLGVLAVGFANAQQQGSNPYEGKVGINTSEPSATLNVKSQTGNVGGKTLELENANGAKIMTALDNGKIGIGKHNPQYILDIASPDEDYHKNSIAIRAARKFQGASGVDIYRSTGTVANPEKVKLGDYLSAFNTLAHTGSIYKLSASVMTAMTGEIDNNTGIVPTSMLFTVLGNNKLIHNPQMLIHHTGNVGIGLGVHTNNYSGYGYIMPNVPTARLHIKPEGRQDPLRLEGLQASTTTTDKIVVADNTGVLKTIERSALGGSATQVGTGENNMPCNEANRGKMNFKKAEEDGKSDIFGICLKNDDGRYYWAYLVGGNHSYNGTGAFGSGIQ